MKTIIAACIFIFITTQTKAQAFEFAPNPTPSWLIMDSAISRANDFTDTLLKGTHTLYLLQSVDSLQRTPTYTYHYVDGNGTALTFIYNYVKHNGVKAISFIEVDGRKEELMNIFNHYFHTNHTWEKEKENFNARGFVYGQKKYILKMSENRDTDGNLTGVTRSAITTY